MTLTSPRRTLRAGSGLLALLAAAACLPDRSAAGAPQQAESAECARQVERSRRMRTDSLFEDARGLVDSCPDAMASTLAALWTEPTLSPERARHLRAVSSLMRDERLASAVETVVRDQARPIESRVEGLSTLSFYLQAGRWVEFTFLKDPPDSASLRMFMGVMEHPMLKEGNRPIPAGYGERFRTMLEDLRRSDSSAAVRSAAGRFLVFLDFVRQQQSPPAPAPPR